MKFNKLGKKNRVLMLSFSVAGFLFSLAWSYFNARDFFSVPEPSWDIKLPLMVSTTGLFIISYFLFLFLYSKWSRDTAAHLENLYKQDRGILFEQYGRIFVRDERIKAMGSNPANIKRLSQTEMRKVYLSIKS